MRFQLATLLTLTFITSLSLAKPVPADDDFQALARDADDAALHAALHAKREYKHGIFPHDRHALEAVRREHADEALQIVRFAVIRRQNSGNSSTTAIRHTSTTTTTEETTTPPEETTTTPTERTTTTPTVRTTTTPTERTTTTLPASTTDIQTESSTLKETSFSSVTPTPTSFTTTRTTTTTDSHGKPLTLTLTDVVVITPTRQPAKTTTGPPGLQTPGGDAGRVELGWVQFGVAVVVGVAGMVL